MSPTETTTSQSEARHLMLSGLGYAALMAQAEKLADDIGEFFTFDPFLPDPCGGNLEAIRSAIVAQVDSVMARSAEIEANDPELYAKAESIADAMVASLSQPIFTNQEDNNR